MLLKPITAIVVLSLVVASLLVAGCTTTTTQSSPTASQQVVVTVTTGGVVATPTATVGGVSAVKVTVPQIIGSGFTKPKTGYEFVGFNVTTSDQTNWQLRDTTGNIYEVISYVTPIDDEGTPIPNTIILMFEVPQNATLSALTYNDRTILDEAGLKVEPKPLY
jgi:hypothetical protein